VIGSISVLTTATARPWASVERTSIWVARTGIGMPRPVTVTGRVRRIVPGARDS
jgi:hypothetical protein